MSHSFCHWARFIATREGARGVWVHAKTRTGDGNPDKLTIDIGIYHENGILCCVYARPFAQTVAA